MTTEKNAARVQGYEKVGALRDWSGLLCLVGEAETRAQPSELARLGAAIRDDARSGARAFATAGELDRADALEAAAKLGGLIVSIAPLVESLTLDDLDALVLALDRALGDAKGLALAARAA